MRILQVTVAFGHGGIQAWLMNVLRAIDRQRFRFDFITHTSDPQPHYEEIRALGGRILPNLDLTRPVRYWRKLTRTLEAEGPYDVVHAHGGNSMGLVLRCAAKAGVPKRIVHSHNLQPKINKRWCSYGYDVFTCRWLFKYATVGLACSSAAGQALFRSRWGVDPRLGILLYGIDFTPFRVPASTRQDVRKELGVPDNAPVVGHVGRFVPEKNHGFLIDVAVEVVKSVPAARFVLVGDGRLRGEIEARIQQVGLSNHFILTGFRTDVPALMQAMDVFVLPSRFEGLGLVLVEAQCAGLRCVYSDAVPQEADVIGDHIRRLSLSAGAGAWSEAICQFLRMLRPDLTKAWEAMSSSHFAIENSVADLVEVYETGRLPEKRGGRR